MHPVGAQLHTGLPAGAEAQTCPFHQGDANLRRCVWPGPLSLSLSAAGAVVVQTFVVDREGPATLPGEPRQWPPGVTVDGRAAAVISLAVRPVLVLPPRTHRIAGRIRWASLPDVLRVPGETGVLSVTLDGRPLPFPQRDTEGRLWLQQARGAAEAADHLEVQVHRRMDDDIPFLRETRLDLTSRGAHSRERWACRPLASTVTAAPQRPLVRVFVDVGEPHQKSSSAMSGRTAVAA